MWREAPLSVILPAYSPIGAARFHCRSSLPIRDATLDLNSIVKHFESLPDPRHLRNRRHLLADVITIAVCGVIVGCPGPTPSHRPTGLPASNRSATGVKSGDSPAKSAKQDAKTSGPVSRAADSARRFASSPAVLENRREVARPTRSDASRVVSRNSGIREYVKRGMPNAFARTTTPKRDGPYVTDRSSGPGRNTGGTLPAGPDRLRR
ncbi:MAG: transposase family protein [Planctomycetes bacterium]|nr:transposase family protein [Planctomycetota bacterium]